MAFSPIPGYDDYFINRDGVVLSKKGVKDRIIKCNDDGHGYNQIGLYKNKKRKCCKVHRLVGLTFIPNPNNYPDIDHIDRNKKNNCVENLRWCDVEMNNVNKPKRKDNTTGFKNICFDKVKKKYVVYIKRNYNYITHKFFNTIEEAILHRNAVLDELGESFDDID